MSVDAAAAAPTPAVAFDVEPGGATVPYRVRFDESTPGGTIRTSALLRYAQDAAWVHSERLGFDRAWYAERRLAWLVRSAEIHISMQIPSGELVLVRTAVVGFRKVMARRRTEFRLAADRGAGDVLAWTHTDWVMTDTDGAPARVPSELPGYFGQPPGTFDPIRVDRAPAPPRAPTGTFAVRSYELDPMAHVNNGVYLDWLEEAVAATGDGTAESTLAAVPRRYRIEYVLPAGPGDLITSAAWRDDPTGSWQVRLARPSGDELARGALDIPTSNG